jgi:hypothetical protein
MALVATGILIVVVILVVVIAGWSRNRGSDGKS